MAGDERLNRIEQATTALTAVRDLATAAFVDKLTGLLNPAAKEALKVTYDSTLKARLTVIFLDLAGFKELNDSYGTMPGTLHSRR